ncbi:hypothetical protein MCUN1_000401 [Malassezia cuniculi]|uniref:Uncharacterized protein n=1 Tax=Malassezia cuniculi TaxID=948313 RepID=A0AAF0EN43_9BASI|nr:hypothetical protein MCUN1_000401 [Malassezia cuniculi]
MNETVLASPRGPQSFGTSNLPASGLRPILSSSEEAETPEAMGHKVQTEGGDHAHMVVAGDTRWRSLVQMIEHRMVSTEPSVPQEDQQQNVMTMHKAPSEKWNEPWYPTVDERDALQQTSIFANVDRDGNPTTFTVGGTHQPKSAIARWKMFLLHNAFVPLLARLTNITLITCTLAVGIVLRNRLNRIDRPHAVGQSPLLTILFSPPSLVHAFFQIWLEYMTRPIGLWGLSSKLWYLAIEIVFTCLWAALLALTFDNYFTSTIACQSNASPFYPLIEQLLKNLGDVQDKASLCGLQIALICLCMVSVFVYVFVFMITLFRIFYRLTPQM